MKIVNEKKKLVSSKFIVQFHQTVEDKDFGQIFGNFKL